MRTEERLEQEIRLRTLELTGVESDKEDLEEEVLALRSELDRTKTTSSDSSCENKITMEDDPLESLFEDQEVRTVKRNEATKFKRSVTWADDYTGSPRENGAIGPGLVRWATDSFLEEQRNPKRTPVTSVDFPEPPMPPVPPF